MCHNRLCFRLEVCSAPYPFPSKDANVIRLTLLTVFVVMPILLFCAYFRLRFEVQFESMNQAVFAESSKFASESINAFRTVTSLTLENMILRRYETLLRDHVNKAFRKSRFTTMVFAFSDSASLACMALTFWYGVRILF
jgi:ATP-binding cassette subfamily B (MDR/TAP) protein 1